jgi:prolipoprotein diacylglyceryltransferase
LSNLDANSRSYIVLWFIKKKFGNLDGNIALLYVIFYNDRREYFFKEKQNRYDDYSNQW